MGPGSSFDADTVAIYALDLRVCSSLEPKWLEDMRNSPRRAGPSFHAYTLHMLSLCCKRFKIQICSAQNIGKVWISGKIPVAPFGPIQVNFPMDWVNYFLWKVKEVSSWDKPHNIGLFFRFQNVTDNAAIHEWGRLWDVLLVDVWVWLIIHNIQGEHYDLLSSWHVVCGS